MAPFSGQDRRCLRNLAEAVAVVLLSGVFCQPPAAKKRDEDATQYPKNRDSGPLTRSLHRKSSRKYRFFSSPCLSGAGVPAGFPAGLLQLPARLQTHTPAPQCRTPKARWRFGPLALQLYNEQRQTFI